MTSLRSGVNLGMKRKKIVPIGAGVKEYFDIKDNITGNITLRGEMNKPNAIGYHLLGIDENKVRSACSIVVDRGSYMPNLIEKNASVTKLIMEMNFSKIFHREWGYLN